MLIKKGQAITKYLRTGILKLNPLIRNLRNKSYLHALSILSTYSTKVSFLIFKTLESAISNAYYLFNICKTQLYIREIYATVGPLLKRTRMKAKGKLTAVLKKQTHLTISVN